jgi:hypothetical protein
MSIQESITSVAPPQQKCNKSHSPSYITLVLTHSTLTTAYIGRKPQKHQERLSHDNHTIRQLATLLRHTSRSWKTTGLVRLTAAAHRIAHKVMTSWDTELHIWIYILKKNNRARTNRNKCYTIQANKKRVRMEIHQRNKCKNIKLRNWRTTSFVSSIQSTCHPCLVYIELAKYRLKPRMRWINIKIPQKTCPNPTSQ